MQIVLVSLLVVIGILSSIVAVQRQQLADAGRQELFVLQEKCAQRAEALFREWDYHNKNFSFINRYSPEHNRCFMSIRGQTPVAGSLVDERFFLDAMERRDWARYWYSHGWAGKHPPQCTLSIPGQSVVPCKSEKEYDEFLKQYMP